MAGCLLKVGQVEMDPDYPVLTRQQARCMQLLSLQAAAERGLEARLEDGWMVFATGDAMSFFNLARKLAALDSEADWAEFVGSNIDVLRAKLYAAEPDPISPSVFWWHGEEYYQVVPPGGQSEVDIPRRLADVLAEMP